MINHACSGDAGIIIPLRIADERPQACTGRQLETAVRIPARGVLHHVSATPSGVIHPVIANRSLSVRVARNLKVSDARRLTCT